MLAEVLAALNKATKGMLYTSVTDAPFEIVHWKSRATIRSSADLTKMIGQSSGMLVEDVGLEKFFHDLIQLKEYYDDHAKKAVGQYRTLLAMLKEHLADLTVFKVGKVDLDIYVMGRTAEGDWAGVMTSAVESEIVPGRDVKRTSA